MDPMRSYSAIPSEPYVLRPPSPPHIPIPATSPFYPANSPHNNTPPNSHAPRGNASQDGRAAGYDAAASESSRLVVLTESWMSIQPKFSLRDPTQLSWAELFLLTSGLHAQSALTTVIESWTYDQRHTAHPVLDPFLWIGPASVARKDEWLRENGITMLVVTRAQTMANIRLMTVEATAARLGIEADYVDVGSSVELVRQFPRAVRAINEHLVRTRLRRAAEDMAVNPPAAQDHQQPQQHGKLSLTDVLSRAKPARVLICCETGNSRSPLLAAAYLMATFGIDLVAAVQFICLKRFCANIDEDGKRVLLAFEDVLRARREVASATARYEAAQDPASFLLDPRMGLAAVSADGPAAGRGGGGGGGAENLAAPQARMVAQVAGGLAQPAPAFIGGQNNSQGRNPARRVTSYNSRPSRKRSISETADDAGEESKTSPMDMDEARFEDRIHPMPFIDPETLDDLLAAMDQS